jgi:hypothetical protein
MEEIDKKERKNIYKILLGGLVFLVVFCIFIWSGYKMKPVKFNEYLSLNSSDIKFCIDSQKYNEKDQTILIDGWSIKEGASIESFKCNVLLKTIKDNSYIQIPTKLVNRKDVTEAFNEKGVNYDNCGFQAKVDISQLDESIDNYEINIYYRNNDENILISTDTILSKGENDERDKK